MLKGSCCASETCPACATAQLGGPDEQVQSGEERQRSTGVGFLLGLAVKRKGQRLRDTMGQFCLDWGLQKVLKYFLYRQGDTRSFSLSIPWQYDASLSLSHVLSYWLIAVVPEGKIVIISLSSRWPDWCREKVSDWPNVLQAAGGTGETQSQYLGSKSQALHPAANHHLSKMQIPIILQGQLKVQDLVSRFAADSCEGTRLRGKSQTRVGVVEAS